MNKTFGIFSMLVLVACASAGADPAGNTVKTDKYQERKAFVEQFAGEAISSAPYSSRSLDFEPLGEEALLLWNGNSRAYLLDVDGFCKDLPWAQAIAVNNNGATLSAKFDSITVMSRDRNFNEKCRIEQIRAVDVPAMKAAEKSKREAEKNK